MAIDLLQDDFQRITRILAGMTDWQGVQSRIDFTRDVFAGSPRQQDILNNLNLDGRPQPVAVRTVAFLAQFGQDRPGQETLGILINKMIEYQGLNEDSLYLEDVLRQYPFKTKPIARSAVTVAWRGDDTEDEIKEKIIGENTLRHVLTLQLALTAARSVARLVTSTSMGTGFLAGERLLMTNNHVIPDIETARTTDVEFNYQLLPDYMEDQVHPVRINVDGLFYTNATLDVTVVELTDIPTDTEPVRLTSRPIKVGNRVSIIQHPGGRHKRISMQNNFVAYADATVVQYTTATESGSSGSPVLDNDFNVIAIHHSGGMMPEPASGRRYLRNAGTPMSAVLRDLRDKQTAIFTKIRT